MIEDTEKKEEELSQELSTSINQWRSKQDPEYLKKFGPGIVWGVLMDLLSSTCKEVSRDKEVFIRICDEIHELMIGRYDLY